jgi:hypothetical protein
VLFLALGLSACGENNEYVGKEFKVTILKPELVEYTAGQPVKFKGSATDCYYDEGEWHEVKITGSDLSWDSSIDGPLGVGEGEFTKSNLSSGEHVITLTAVGVNDATKSAKVRITINP